MCINFHNVTCDIIPTLLSTLTSAKLLSSKYIKAIIETMHFIDVGIENVHDLSMKKLFIGR